MTYHVYRYWRENDALYVGCSGQVSKRLRVHLRRPHSMFADKIDACEIEDFELARAFEASEIARLRPEWNHVYNPDWGFKPRPYVEAPGPFVEWAGSVFERFAPVAK